TLAFGYNKVIQERVGIANTSSIQLPPRIFRILHLSTSRSYFLQCDPPSRLLRPVLQRIADWITRTTRMDYRREVRLAYLQNLFRYAIHFLFVSGSSSDLISRINQGPAAAESKVAEAT